MINLPSFHPFFVLKLEVRALLQIVCNGICGLVASKIFSGEDSPRYPYDSRAFSARSRTNYFKLATPLIIYCLIDMNYNSIFQNLLWLYLCYIASRFFTKKHFCSIHKNHKSTRTKFYLLYNG